MSRRLPKSVAKKKRAPWRIIGHGIRFRIARSRTGLGFFAETPIRRGRFIIEYTGRRRLWANVPDRSGKYLFDIDDTWVLDGSARRNTARYINHSCKPNAVAYGVGKRIRIYARRTIQPGEEVTYDYGKDYFDTILEGIGCRCEACAAGQGRTAAKRKRASPKEHAKPSRRNETLRASDQDQDPARLAA